MSALHHALSAFAQIHASDPRLVTAPATRAAAAAASMTHSQRYHQALGRWVTTLSAGEPCVALRLAAASQHLRRWEVPRKSYPVGRAGYKLWRSDLLTRHAQGAAEVMIAAGFDGPTVQAVRELIEKKQLGSDPQMQLFEDAICLSFIECELAEFAAQQSRNGLVRILRKTWKKMSPHGHTHARRLLAEMLGGPATDAQAQLQEVLTRAGL